jgi:hypothetical protein
MIEQFFLSLKDNGITPISMDETFAVTKTTFAIIKSLQEAGAPVKF